MELRHTLFYHLTINIAGDDSASVTLKLAAPLSALSYHFQKLILGGIMKRFDSLQFLRSTTAASFSFLEENNS